jgi:hypothetical protein
MQENAGLPWPTDHKLIIDFMIIFLEHVILCLLENLFGFSVKLNGCGCAARIGIRGSVGEKRNATLALP